MQQLNSSVEMVPSAKPEPTLPVEIVPSSARPEHPRIAGDRRIFLYNEDGYTLWVLVERLPQLLAALGDTTPANSGDIQIFYRPSFGRGEDPLFGEPDLLIGTPERVYHIESKPKLTSKRRKSLELDVAQVFRHGIFQIYRSLWQKYRPTSWEDFLRVALTEYLTKIAVLDPHRERTMPTTYNLMSANLEFVLKTLESCGPEVCDALLLFERTENSITYTNPHGFRSVVMPLEMIPGTNFVAVWMTPEQ